jgi:hypothetical protein
MKRAAHKTVSVSSSVSAALTGALTPSLPSETQGLPAVSALACFNKESEHTSGSSAWSGRIIFARDLEPVHTHLEPTPTGPRLHLESETFTATLPASPFILEKLAAKLARTVTA